MAGEHSIVAARVPGGVPLPANPIIGRTRELAEARRLLGLPSVRLLTVTGPPGVGKSRLAIEVAHELGRGRPDGLVRYIDLAAVQDPVQVRGGVAALLWNTRLDLDEIDDSDHRFLFVLDTFEHVQSAAEWIASILAAVPNVQFLVTSRVRLGLQWERAMVLNPLAVPEQPARLSVKQLARLPSVALFVERARTRDPAFQLTADNANAVATLTSRLDGVPLAVEMAAGNVHVLSTDDLLAHVESEHLPLMATPWSDSPPRHQSLEAAVDWSYRLLSEADRAVFRQLGVFVGGFSSEAAADVCGVAEIVATLSRLVDASLVQVEHTDGDGRRFHMLEITRAFAHHQLDITDQSELTRAAHARWCAGFVADAAEGLSGPHQDRWLRGLDLEFRNCLAALAYADEYLRQLVGGLGPYWLLSGHFGLADRWLVQSGGLELAGLAAAMVDDAERANNYFEAALRSARGWAARRIRATSAVAAWACGELAERLPKAHGTLAPTDAYSAWALGMLALRTDDLETAVESLTIAREGYQGVPDAAGQALALMGLATAALRAADRDRATGCLASAIPFVERVNRAPLNVWLALLILQLRTESTPVEALQRLIAVCETTRIDGDIPLPTVLRTDLVEAINRAHADGLFAAEPPGLDEFVEAARVCLHSNWSLEQRTPQDTLLSPRELDVIRLLAEGATNKEIAAVLVVAEATARFHVSSLLGKLGAANRTQAVTLARRRGLV